MQITPSPIKRDNVYLNKLITGMGLPWTLFLQTFEMKKSTAFPSKMIQILQGAFS